VTNHFCFKIINDLISTRGTALGKGIFYYFHKPKAFPVNVPNSRRKGFIDRLS